MASRKKKKRTHFRLPSLEVKQYNKNMQKIKILMTKMKTKKPNGKRQGFTDDVARWCHSVRLVSPFIFQRKSYITVREFLAKG